MRHSVRMWLQIKTMADLDRFTCGNDQKTLFMKDKLLKKWRTSSKLNTCLSAVIIVMFSMKCIWKSNKHYEKRDKDFIQNSLKNGLR